MPSIESGMTACITGRIGDAKRTGEDQGHKWKRTETGPYKRRLECRHCGAWIEAVWNEKTIYRLEAMGAVPFDAMYIGKEEERRSGCYGSPSALEPCPGKAGKRDGG